MMPSVEPLNLKVYLGYMDYPTDSSYIAMTEMPLEGVAKGDESFRSFLDLMCREFRSAQLVFDVVVAVPPTEDRYTWLLKPEDLKGNTGAYYLMVRPVVGPGIKSINATLSISSITTACKFWNESTLDWSSRGCKVTPSVASGVHSVFFCLFFLITVSLHHRIFVNFVNRWALRAPPCSPSASATTSPSSAAPSS